MLISDLKAARLSCGWTQKALADRIGVDAQVVKRLEKSVGSMRVLEAAMNALDFRLNGLGTGSNLAAQLRARRIARGWSLELVANRSGLSRTTVAGLERGGGSVASAVRLINTLAPSARRRARERTYWSQDQAADRDARFTPPDFMATIYDSFGAVDLDPCGHPSSPVVARRRILLSEGGDGLTDDWDGRLAFVNPPYSQLLKWLRRAFDQWRSGRVETVVCLVPVRTDSEWFHETLRPAADIYLLRGRVRFLNPKGANHTTPFSLMLVVLGGSMEQMSSLSRLLPGFWLDNRHQASAPVSGTT